MITRLRTFVHVVCAAALAGATLWAAPSASANHVTIIWPPCESEAVPVPTAEPDEGYGDRSCTPEGGQPVDGEWTITFHVSAGGAFGRLRRVELYILSEDPAIPSPGQESAGDGTAPPVAAWVDGGGSFDNDRAATLSFTWDTVELTPYNGSYTIRVRAWGNGDGPGQFSQAERTDVRVNNAPRVPARPVATAGSHGNATVTWEPAAEPDAEWFAVWRARTDGADVSPRPGDFRRIANRVGVGTRTWTDRDLEPGAYWYRVQVARHSVVNDDDVILSELSERSARAAVIAAAAPPAGEATPAPAPQRATPRPIAVRPQARAVAPAPTARPRLPDAPFSTTLPYDGIPAIGAPEQQPPPFGGVAEQEPDAASRAALLPVAIGAFLTSAALSLRRLTG